MSLEVDGVWKGGLWASTVWADGVWREGAPPAPIINPKNILFVSRRESVVRVVRQNNIVRVK